MPEILDKWPERKTRGETYPWDKWFDGQIWKLLRGVDFKSDELSFRTAVLLAAKKREIRVRTTVPTEIPGCVIFQKVVK